jgi:hypothetical protein
MFFEKTGVCPQISEPFHKRNQKKVLILFKSNCMAAVSCNIRKCAKKLYPQKTQENILISF